MIKSSNNALLKQGDALTELGKLEAESVDCCITSPPYWALRDYKVQGQLGLEPTIDEYINKLVAIFDQVKRVLKRCGTCWVVIGDTYGRGERTTNVPQTKAPKVGTPRNYAKSGYDKCLMMIPERFSIKMIDHGWILRNKIIWYKPNCMPSSAKDRFTVDWEYVYFFTKSQRYFFETQYEPLDSQPHKPGNKLALKNLEVFPSQCNHRTFKYMNEHPDNVWGSTLGRIKRCVWKISTKPFSGAHFAVFPPDLIKPMIKAGCPSEGVVLDPFMGAGTTGLVALQNARNFIGIELNAEYIKLAEERLTPFLKQRRLTECLITQL